MQAVTDPAVDKATAPAGEDAPAISLHEVTKRYGALTAVDGLSLEIPRGRTVALLGSNGAGKSTTVGMLMDLTRPDEGRVLVGGRAPRRWSPGRSPPCFRTAA